MEIDYGKSMHKSRNKILYVLFFFYLIISVFQIYSLSGKVSKYEVADRLENNRKQIFKLVTDKIKDEITGKFSTRSPTSSAVIRSVMEYVQKNSLHQIDNSHKRYSFNNVLKKMYLASRGNIHEKPDLSCGPRAYAMRAILKKFNIYSRLVQIYSDNNDTLAGHRLLEVYNSDRQAWEVWDPEFAVTFVDRKTRISVDIITLVFSDKDNFIPIGITEEGWENTKTEHLKKNYFEAVLFEKESGITDLMKSDMDNAVIIVNSALFETEKVLSSGVTFRAWAQKVYGAPRIISISNKEATVGKTGERLYD